MNDEHERQFGSAHFWHFPSAKKEDSGQSGTHFPSFAMWVEGHDLTHVSFNNR